VGIGAAGPPLTFFLINQVKIAGLKWTIAQAESQKRAAPEGSPAHEQAKKNVDEYRSMINDLIDRQANIFGAKR
jgi:hypothetical protein